MIQSLIKIVQGTPIWVWALFIFLVYRGVQACKPRHTTFSQMLVLPILFFIWPIISIVNKLHFLFISFSGFISGLIVGIVMGWLLWRNVQNVEYDSVTKNIYRPGSILPLLMILSAFSTKYVLMTLLAMHNDYSISVAFNFIFGAISGLIDGLFLGGLLLQIRFLNHVEKV